MLQAKHISKIFNKGKADEVKALDDVNVEIHQGEFAIIIGANGSGKSTFFNVIQGGVLPSSGSILLSGKDISEIAEHKRSRYISRVFQNPSQGTAPDLSIRENFRLAALRSRNKKIRIGNNDSFSSKVSGSISSLGMGLEKKLDQPMGSLSGGQRQALTLLMSVMDDTELLLMDEPTAALDPRSAAMIMQLAEKLNKERGLTLLMVTHNLKDAWQYGNRLIQFREGKIIRDLDADEKKQVTLPEIFSWFE